MTRIRGLSFIHYLGKTKCQCGLNGYLEEWQSYLSRSYSVFSVKHVKNNKTIKRCWLLN